MKNMAVQAFFRNISQQNGIRTDRQTYLGFNYVYIT